MAPAELTLEIVVCAICQFWTVTYIVAFDSKSKQRLPGEGGGNFGVTEFPNKHFKGP